MVQKLYVLGNGFDLHHGLKTSYYDFAIYLKSSHRQLYDLLIQFINHPNSNEELWGDFEENLAHLDIDELLSDNTDLLPNYMDDDFRDRDRYAFPDQMDLHLDLLTKDLFSEFENFIKSVVYIESSFERKIQLDNASLFLTFNYTNTLEKLYNIEKNKIIYIHNSVYDKYNNIILGHGIEPQTLNQKLDPPSNLSPEELEEWYSEQDSGDYSYEEGKNTIIKYFSHTFKPTKQIILNHKPFFNNLINIKDIYILGHSISKVDLPYFIEIYNSVGNNCNWHISFYNENERLQHIQTLNKIGVSNITQFKLIDIQSFNKQLEFKF
jgi:hypothetical protein